MIPGATLLGTRGFGDAIIRHMDELKRLSKGAIFDRDCRQCPRLSEFLDAVQERYPDYYCRPVPPFGDSKAHFLVVGLAPGMHGANRSGRPFTGDHAGILLYQMMHKYGCASRDESVFRR